MKIPKLFGSASAVPVIMIVATLFLAGVLIKSAVSQFIDNQWFSGCVSILGILLVLVTTMLLVGDLVKKKDKK